MAPVGLRVGPVPDFHALMWWGGSQLAPDELMIKGFSACLAAAGEGISFTVSPDCHLLLDFG